MVLLGHTPEITPVHVDQVFVDFEGTVLPLLGDVGEMAERLGVEVRVLFLDAAPHESGVEHDARRVGAVREQDEGPQVELPVLVQLDTPDVLLHDPLVVVLVPDALGAHLAVLARGVQVARVDLVGLEDVAAVDVQRVAVEVVALELVLGRARRLEHAVLLRELRAVLLDPPAAVVLEVEQRHGVLDQASQECPRDIGQARLAFDCDLLVVDEFVEPRLGAQLAHVRMVVEQTHLGVLRLHEFGLVEVGLVLAPHHDVLLPLDELDVGLAHLGVAARVEHVRHQDCFAEDAQLVVPLQLLLAFLL